MKKKTITRSDTGNIGGLTDLMNKQHMKKGINLLEVESSIIGKTNNKHDIAKEQAKLLDELSKDLNLDISSLIDSDVSDNEDNEDNVDNDGDNKVPIKEEKRSKINDSSSSSSSDDSEDDYKRSDNAREERNHKKEDPPKKRYSADDIKETLNKLDFEEEYRDDTLVIPKMRADKYSDEKFTNSDPINNVLSDLRGVSKTSHTKQNEEIRDQKNFKLEQIQELKKILKEDGVSCDDYNDLTINNTIGEIDAVLENLRYKNNRQRYSEIANEALISTAEFIESIFDGTKKIPILGYKPNYQGYHNTLHSKLHRMRFDTAEVVGDLLKSLKVSPPLRVAIEILPGFLAYPQINKRQHQQKNLSSDPSFGDMRDTLNAIQSAKDLENIRKL